MNDSKSVWNALAATSGHAGALAVAIALAIGPQANAAVSSADIVDGQVKTVDLASGAVTTPKIANNAVTSAKVQDNSLSGSDIQDGSLTGNDINQATLGSVNAWELNGFQAAELIRIGHVSTAGAINLPSCSPGLVYLAKSISVPFDGHVLVTAMFTAHVYTSIASRPVATRVETDEYLGIWAEDHTAPGSANQRSNVVSSDVFPVRAGVNNFRLRVCDGSDDSGVASVRAAMTFVYTPMPEL
jgi:hypothetical protein